MQKSLVQDYKVPRADGHSVLEVRDGCLRFFCCLNVELIILLALASDYENWDSETLFEQVIDGAAEVVCWRTEI